ncbi:HTH-type transcriptional activator IlvY [Kribbella sindirgiensis]|uniref:HTH-type transcriptional activator IlvY n=1 Tax=Kribbella sindirgiensis TaxID=1124744 RepID=A0A4V2M4R3_9ACTN|nr:HTH-type transcriptional activator IlvY [Kribbella sindirgiensis]TCC36952.1 HTH-type transcriptional activator IlvY [Kribbella sindirgiensis]
MSAEHRELELFLHLARTLNYGRTSLECHVSAATLTRTIQRLETRVGAQLLDRGPRGVVLTAEGRRFSAYAEQALGLWAEYQAGSGEPAGLSGELRIFATVTACQTLLPELLAPLRVAHPQIRLDIRTGDAAAALARLDEGEVDAAVAGIPKRLPQTLVSRPVAITDLVLVRARESPSDKQSDAGSDGPSTAPSHGPFVVPARGLVREAAFRWFRRSGVKPVIAAEPDGHEALLALVALGCGTGVVPRLVLESSAVRDQLVELPADLEPLTIGLCARRADLHRPLIAALWDLRP